MGRGTRTYIMDPNPTQELASVIQDPLFLVFMDLIKSYENLDRGQILKTLERYGLGRGKFGAC